MEPETQNLSTLKPGDNLRTRTNEEKTCKKVSVIVPDDCLRPYNVLKEKGNLIIRNRRYLIPTNENLIVKHYYDNTVIVFDNEFFVYWN